MVFRFSALYTFRISLLLTLMSVVFPIGAAPAPTMDSFVTCAVYHRMMAGSFRRVRQMPEMANLESEKMDDFIKLAKNAGKAEFDESEVEAAFLESWKYNLGEMENKINRNYKNVSSLTYIYKNNCKKLLK
jgi:hypothetical protein